MSLIFVISPCYLEAIYNESKKYDFDLQGYGSFKKGVEGLTLSNSVDILGFAFVGMHLPTSHSKEFKEMLRFFDLIELMNANKKFVIASDESVVPWSKVFARYKNIRFVKTPEYDFISDIIINKHVFGSILLDNADAYELIPKEVTLTEFTVSRLEYVPLFAGTQLQCVGKVEVLDTLDRTLDFDEVYKRFKTEGAYLQVFRKYYIAKKMHNEDACNLCTVEIEKILENQQSNTENWCALVALKDYIEENYNE